MSGGGTVSRADPGSPSVPSAAITSSRGLPSCASVARAVLRLRPLRITDASISQSTPELPGRR
jgi:hypothetical protein